LSIERDQKQEENNKREFINIQNDIFSKFGTCPATPTLTLARISQTYLVIKWDPLSLYSSTFRGIEIYKNGIKLSNKPSKDTNIVKLGGLLISTEYEVYIVLKTSAGSFASNKIVAKTLAMDDLKSLHISFGAFSDEGDIDSSLAILEKYGASFSEEITAENSHLICTIPKGPKYEKALELNIPCVTPEFLKECENNSLIQPSNLFYVKK
jgi:hypothetical protein